MSIDPFQQNDADYNRFLQFRDTFVVNRQSYFDPSVRFTEQTLEAFENAILANYLTGSRTFGQKINVQLRNANRELRHFTANLLWLYNFIFSSEAEFGYKVDKSRKRKYDEVYNVLKENIDIEFFPEYGYANAGQAYKTKKYEEFAYYFLFIKNIYTDPTLLEDGQQTQLIQIIKSMDIVSAMPNYTFQRLKKAGAKNILLFLFVPERFEPIVSYTDKTRIARAFLPDNKGDLDEAIFKIRSNENIVGSFYESPNIQRWQPKDFQIITISTQENTEPPIKSRKMSTEDEDDLMDSYKNKLAIGLQGEELVAKYLFEKYMSKDKGQSVNMIQKKLQEIGYKPEDIYSNFQGKDLRTISHFSKNLHTKAPFDIIYTKYSEVYFAEVKSTSSSADRWKIYFSVYELNFATEYPDSYEVYVVVNSDIYQLDTEKLMQAYSDLHELLTERPSLSVENIGFTVTLAQVQENNVS